MSETPIYTIYQPEGEAQPGDSIECRVIGAIRTPYKRMEDCPSRHNKRERLPCTIRLAPEAVPDCCDRVLTQEGIELLDEAALYRWLQRNEAATGVGLRLIALGMKRRPRRTKIPAPALP